MVAARVGWAWCSRALAPSIRVDDARSGGCSPTGAPSPVLEALSAHPATVVAFAPLGRGGGYPRVVSIHQQPLPPRSRQADPRRFAAGVGSVRPSGWDPIGRCPRPGRLREVRMIKGSGARARVLRGVWPGSAPRLPAGRALRNRCRPPAHRGDGRRAGPGLTMVALQLSSIQFSPPMLRKFLRDRANQLVLSVSRYISRVATRRWPVALPAALRGVRVEVTEHC